MVGMVVTISPSFSLYRMVVLPAASSPTCRDRRAVRQTFITHARSSQTSDLNAHHEDPHLLLGEEAGKELREGQPHLEVTSTASTRYSRYTTLCAPQVQAEGLTMALWKCSVYGRRPTTTAQLKHAKFFAEEQYQSDGVVLSQQ